jgi:hypothetical protein
MTNNCDKCGKPVSRDNDAVRIEAIASGNSLLLLLANPRCFLPTEDCEGSPSRAQYIEGQPRDTRGYQYNQTLEARYRQALKELIEEK